MALCVQQKHCTRYARVLTRLWLILFLTCRILRGQQLHLDQYPAIVNTTNTAKHVAKSLLLSPTLFPCLHSSSHTHIMAPNKASFHVKHEVSTREHSRAKHRNSKRYVHLHVQTIQLAMHRQCRTTIPFIVTFLLHH